MRRERPCRRDTTDKANKFPPPHGRLRHERTGHTKHSTWKGFAYVRFGSKADICAATSHVRFTPNSDRECGLPQTVMSALPLKADMCGALAHVCFGPIADIGPYSIT